MQPSNHHVRLLILITPIDNYLFMNILRTVLILLASFLTLQLGVAQNTNPWTFETSFRQKEVFKEKQFKKARSLALNKERLEKILVNAPLRFSKEAEERAVILTLPSPNGEFNDYKIVEAPVLHPDLGKKFPEIKSYAGQGISDPTAYLRFDWSPHGFHAVILSGTQPTIIIDTEDKENRINHYIYYKKDRINTNQFPFTCTVQHAKNKKEPLVDLFAEKRSAGDCQLRTYRLALACTGEYARFHGGTTADALAAMNATMTRVNGIFESDVAVTMQIIPNNTSIIYLNANTDPYSNNNGQRMLPQNQETIDNIIGTANYDVGHVFSTGGGGIASLAGVCNFREKAQGVTGFTEPEGDQFDLDFVAHEFGHQFGAEHTFSGNEESCNPQTIAEVSAVEPGSGSTIMGYAQLCGSENIQLFSDAYFHARSIVEISSFILSAGNSCAQITDLDNEPPIVNAGANYRIPQSTPFVLTGSASDVDSRGLTYAWEQMDRSTTQPQPPLSSNRSGPLFRSFSPSNSPQRFFPRLEDLVANINPKWEVLPASNRNMTFRFTVRDNNMGGGCTEEDDMSITVNAEAGPFLVNHPNTSTVTWIGNDKEQVTWDVANTDAVPISATEVDIYLSMDGGFTYPELLVEGVPNTGSAEIIVPNSPTDRARIMVKGANNIFFDISNEDFTISPTLNDFVTDVSPSSQVLCAAENAVFDIDIGVSGTLDGAVVLSTQGLPNSLTASFSNNNFTPPSTTRLSIQTNGTVSEGNYPFTLNITGSTGVQTRELSVSVIDGGASNIQLSEPSNDAIGVSIIPTFQWTAVSGVNEYILRVAKTPNFAAPVLEETVSATEFTLLTSLELTTRYYWQVLPKGTCFGDVMATTSSFLTAELACEIFMPTDLPQDISSDGEQRIGSFIDVPISGTITDVNILNLDIDHTWIADLLIGIVSPEETGVILVSDICDRQANMRLSFDDESGNSYNSIPCPPTNRSTYSPLDSLSLFNGEDMEGEWGLIIIDQADDDGGTFNNWALEVCYLGEPKSIPLAISFEKTDVTCSNAQDGRISVNAVDGLGTYTYTWNNGATTATIENLSPASYTVTVSDGSTSIEETVTINPATPIDLTIIENAPSCFGLSDGSIEISSNEALTYAWNTGATTAALGRLRAGTYTLEVTNAQNCKENRTFVLTEPPKIINTLTPKPITCAGGMDGAVTLSLFDDNNHSFQWSNAATTQNLDNLSVGTYSVTVTTANNCQETTDVVITEPAPIRVIAVATSPSCMGGMDAELSAEGNDGVAPYNYNWSTGATTAIVPAVPVGTYQVTVTDANNCSNSAELTVTESTKFININLEVISASCSGVSDGQISAEITDGLAPFTYMWNDGSNTSMVDSINEGLYRVTVTDANSCSNIAEMQVEEPKPINIDFTIINASCFGAADGQIVANITGGTGEYTYLWDNGMTIKSLLEVTAGNYSLTVTDENNCQAISQMSVSQTTDIAVNITPVMLSCNGASDGQILTEVEEANGPYTYTWSNGSTAESIGNLPAGTYSLTITAANTCEKVLSVELTEPNPLVLNSVITPISCNGLSDGQIEVVVVGGEEPYSYTWDSPDPFEQNELGSGTYGLTITDVAGCSVSELFILEEPTLIEARFSSTSISDVDSMDGQIISTVRGGAGPYSFVWDTGDSTANLTNIGTGTYILTVTDANACSRAFAAVVQGVECSNFTLDLSIAEPLCADMPNGMITAMASGGSEPYQYEWSTGDTTRQIANLISGQYALTITDALGCSLNDMQDLEPTSNIQLMLSAKTDFSCQNQVFGSAKVEAINGSGNYTYSWSNGETSAEIFNLEPGNYTVIVQDELACAANLEVAILSTDVSRPPVFRETTTAYLDAMGMVTLTPENLLALAIDSCSIQQLEFSELQFDCADIGEQTITATTTFVGDLSTMELLNIEVVDTIKPIIQCPEDIVIVSACTDTVFYELEEGIDNCGPVFYMFPAGTESGSVFSEDTTTITYTIADQSDNSVTCTFRVIKEMELSVTVDPEVPLTYEIDEDGVYVITSIEDCMQPDLSDFFLVQGGTEPYEVESELLAGTVLFNRYVIRISDVNGCQTENVVVVPIPTEDGTFVLNSEITPVTIGAKDGSIELEVVDGLSLEYKWFRGNTLLSREKDIFELSAGTYTLVIEDMFGCSMVDSFMIDMLVSANDVYLNRKIDLFPNPTTGEVTIEFALEKQQMVAVDLYDVNGQLVRPTLNYSAKNDRIQIDLNNFAKGIYLAKIQVEDEVVVKKIVLH